jgi:uncharacterized membrane protein
VRSTNDKLIDRWRQAGLIDEATAARIRHWEGGQAPSHGNRLSRFAFAFGGVMLGAGVALFVAANWDMLAPWARFATLAGTVALLHLAGGLAESRSAALATTMHAVGTAAFGAAVFLAGQVFNLAENWPQGFLLWAIGAGVVLLVRRDWPHALWVALLVPSWLHAEWIAAVSAEARGNGAPLVGWVILGVAYTAAVGPDRDSVWRRALSRLGAILLIPAAILLPFVAPEPLRASQEASTSIGIAWMVAVGLPLLAGWWLRGRAAWPLLVVAAIAVAIATIDTSQPWQRVLAHVLYALSSVGLVWWGLRESHPLRVNVGVAGFALTVLSFYYSSVFGRFGRALGLIGMGVLFIGGGWWLERTRRRLLGSIDGGGA